MVIFGKPGKQEFKYQKVFEFGSFASLRWILDVRFKARKRSDLTTDGGT